MAENRSAAPFAFDFPETWRARKALLQWAVPPLEKALCLTSLKTLYTSIPGTAQGPGFASNALAAMDVTIQCPGDDIARIPDSGPLIVVANHPFGGIEGMVLADLLSRRRADVKIMANFLLHRVPEFKELFIPVDPFGNGSALKRNIGPLKQAIRWVKKGGCLALFPAGEVSSFNVRKRAVTDPHWSSTVGRLARTTAAQVLPVFFKGSNGPLFQVMGLINDRFRTVMLPRELLNKRRSVVHAAVGTPLHPSRLKRFHDDEELTSYLRLRTYVLKHRITPSRKRCSSNISPDRKPIPSAAPADAVAHELLALPGGCRLIDNGDFAVFAAQGKDIPDVLMEIGRLRELNFREVGEGTGRERDLDRFDDQYHHLILWNTANREIAGAYRMGLTDHILEKQGPSGLYTNTLFKYKNDFLKHIDPALELGRAFVHAPYRKSYFPLMLLWKAIGCFVAANMRYRLLFGPVSISSAYHPFCRAFMIEFLKRHHLVAETDLLKAVRPRRNPRTKVKPPGGMGFNAVDTLCRDIDEVSGLVAEVEKDGKGVPVLLRQYLKLGGTLLTFNRDSDFADALDGLILVDLLKTPGNMLSRYLGQEAAQSFRHFHAS